MVVGVACHDEGSNQVGVSCGFRQVRPWASNQSVRSLAQLDAVWSASDHLGLWVLKSPRIAVGVRSSRSWVSRVCKPCPLSGTLW